MEIFCWRIIYTKDLLLKNLGSCWPTILISRKHQGTFRCSYCTADYQRHYNIPARTCTGTPHWFPKPNSVFSQSLKLQLSSEDAQARNRFSNLISNASGVGHLSIFCKYEAFLKHESILASAPFVVQWCWWPLVTQPDGKQGQLILVSELEFIERFIARTSIRTVLRCAESYHAFSTVQSFACHLAKILASWRIDHEYRDISGLQLNFHFLHVRDNPQPSIPWRCCTFTFEQLSKAGPI